MSVTHIGKVSALKKLLLIALAVILVTFGLYKSYFMIMPSVIVENISAESVKLVEVTLPSNRLVFENINPGTIQQIYYSLGQHDGEYVYRVLYADNTEKNVKCGYVTSNEVGKTHRLTIHPLKVLSCNGKNV